jgi:hypothetical protein
MPQYYRLANAAITSLSVDGIEHIVNEDGVLEVHTPTVNLTHELTTNFGAIEVNKEAEEKPADPTSEEIERQELFSKLDAAYGRPLDRRRSLRQLRQMWETYQAKHAAQSGQGQLRVVDVA